MPQNDHKTFKVLGLLLRYPNKTIIEACAECQKILAEEALLSSERINDMNKLIEYLQNSDLIELEEKYVSLFDFKRLLSLYLFEHSHGDSRDRGQALVDLIAHYEKHKLELQPGEMPDYLPVFLEHLSFFSLEDAMKALAAYVNTISIIEKRLQEHQSLYSAVFSAIRSLSSIEEDGQYVDKIMSGYSKKKDSNKDLDEQWEAPEAFPEQCPIKCSSAVGGDNVDFRQNRSE